MHWIRHPIVFQYDGELKFFHCRVISGTKNTEAADYLMRLAAANKDTLASQEASQVDYMARLQAAARDPAAYAVLQVKEDQAAARE